MTSRDSSGAESATATVQTDEQTARKIAHLVDEGFSGSGVAIDLVNKGGGLWQVLIHVSSASDEVTVRDLIAAAGPEAAKGLTFARVTAKNWVAESLAGLKPVQAGRFVVHGAHDRARIPINRIGIEIEAALAFGTGHHGTTRGCLLALDRVRKTISKPRRTVHRHPEVRARRGSKCDGPSASAVALRGSSLRDEHLRVMGKRLHILDLGTGSGVLAIAAARALRQRVLATDIDAQAVRAARGNARLNGAGPFIDAVRADGVARRAVLARAPFDLVFANILLGPLQLFAAPLRRLTAPGARVILSGLLSAQANAAIAAYRPLALERRIDLDGWTTLVFVRRCP